MTAVFSTRRDGKIIYEDYGKSSSACVFLHGFAGHSGLWRKQMNVLSPFMRVLSVNWPGHGGSLWYASTVEDLAADVLDLVRACGINKVVVAANSWGVLPALRMRSLSSDCVRGLFLTGGLPKFTGSSDFPAGLDSLRIRKLAGQIEQDMAGTLGLFFRSLFTFEERLASGYGYVRDLLLSKPLPEKEALLSFLDSLEIEDLREVLRGSGCPIHFLFGDSDPICPTDVFHPLKQLCLYAVFHVFSGCGHFPFLTRADDTSALLGEVCQRVLGIPSGFKRGVEL